VAVNLSPIDLVAANPWRRTIFTTYALSLSFFEAVVLDALVRGGSQDCLILADIEGVRASLSELGACRVGKDYHLEPVAVTTGRGVFHPKISVLCGESECHLLVGSGNLTFGGWGGNLEVLEHLHPSFAADAILDAADFFERLSTAAHIRHAAAAQCHTIADELRAATRDHARNGNIRLYHSLTEAITVQLARVVDDLGGARRLTIASPFWDGGTAVDRVCEAIGLDHVYVHAHSGDTVRGNAGSNWPASAAVAVKAVRLEVMEEEAPRSLHAKAVEVLCNRGRILLSGSANATMAAFGAGQNVEACVLRIQRERLTGWRFSPTKPLDPTQVDEIMDEIESARPGVLRAVLEGNLISGEVLAPHITGDASVFLVSGLGRQLLGQTRIGDRGEFEISASGLEVQSWKGGRLVLRVESADGRAAEGFVLIAAYAALTRRLGPLGPRLFAIIAGTETPADVAAILTWFHEDPRRLLASDPTKIRGQSSRSDADNQGQTMIPVLDLKARQIGPSTLHVLRDPGDRHWSRFMEHVIAAFRERRGPLGGTSSGRKGDDDADDDAGTANGAAPAADPSIDKSLRFFDRLFDQLLLRPTSAITAFDFTQYVCERLAFDSVKAGRCLQRLITIALASDVPLERRDDIAAAILTQLGAKPDLGGERSARARLLKLRHNLSGPPPSPSLTEGFQSVLPQRAGFAELWQRIGNTRTYPELASAYLRALEAGQSSGDYVDLLAEVPEERAVLEQAFGSAQARPRIAIMKRLTDACPRCHIVLPAGERSKLRAKSVATARGCCNRVVIWPGD
jgi:hypothetical protein